MRKLLFMMLLCLLPLPALGQVNIIYGSGLPEIANMGSGGLPALSGLVESRRAQGQAPFFIFGGESLGPSMLGGMDQGSHMIDILNSMGIDLMQVSKRELAYKEDQLSLRASEAFFPLVASNIIDPKTGSGIYPLEEYALERFGDSNVGVIALLGRDLLYAYPISYAVLSDADQTVRDLSAKLKAEGADLILVLMNYDADSVEKRWLEEGLADIVISNSATGNEVQAVGDGLLISQSSTGGEAVDIYWPDKRVEFVTLAGLEQNPATLDKINQYLRQMDVILDVEVGVTLTEFDTLRENVRSRENAFCSYTADVLRRTVGSDVALVNGGDFRGNRVYPAGTMLMRRDLKTELPFGNEAVLLELSGEQLRLALEHGLSLLEERSGRFLHVSGMRVVYDPKQTPGQRLVSVEVGGKPLSPTATYTLGTSNYLASGGDGFYMLQEAKVLPSPAIQISEALRQAIIDAGSISPVIDHRLQVVE